jgi:hypothetical protein
LSEKKFVGRSKRLESINLVSLSHKDTEGRTDMESIGRTLDLSKGGILLELPSALPSPNEEVEITLGIRDKVIRAKGKIVHQRQLDNGHFGLGISFHDLEEDDAQVISDFFTED